MTVNEDEGAIGKVVANVVSSPDVLATEVCRDESASDTDIKVSLADMTGLGLLAPAGPPVGVGVLDAVDKVYILLLEASRLEIELLVEVEEFSAPSSDLEDVAMVKDIWTPVPVTNEVTDEIKGPPLVTPGGDEDEVLVEETSIPAV